MLRQLTGSGDEIRIFPSNCYWYYLSTLLKHWFGVVQHRSSLVGQGQNCCMEECWRCGEASLGNLRWVSPGPFALVRRSPTRYLAFLWTHLTCFAFSMYYPCPCGFWFLELLATINSLRCCWPFPNEMSCHHLSACSRRWLSAPWPSPSFSELPRAPSWSPWECWNVPATRPPPLAGSCWPRGGRTTWYPGTLPAMLFVLLKWCWIYVLAMCKPLSWRAPPFWHFFENTPK